MERSTYLLYKGSTWLLLKILLLIVENTIEFEIRYGATHQRLHLITIRLLIHIAISKFDCLLLCYDKNNYCR